MGLEWHNRKRSYDGRFAKRAQGLSDEAGIEIAQLHVRVQADTAAEVRKLARQMKMEISELVEIALEKCIEDIYALAEAQQQGDGEPAEEQPVTGEPAEDQQRASTD